MKRHINDRFVAAPNIRGPGWDLNKSNCEMKNQQKCLVTFKRLKIVNDCCKKSWLDTPKYPKENVNSSSNLKNDKATKPVAPTKRRVVIDKFISSHMNGLRVEISK